MSGTHCRYYWAAWGALPLLAGLMLLSVAKGSVPLSLTQVLGALRLLDVPVSEMIGRIVIDLRVPRTLLAVLAGAVLAIVGGLLQTTTRNDLADPFLFGLSSGASAGAVLVITRFGERLGALTLPVSAFVGGICSAVAVMLLFHFKKQRGAEHLVICGLAISFLFGALTSYLIFSGDQRAASSVLFWSLGGLGLARWDNLPYALFSLLLLGAFILLRWRSLDGLLAGEQTAQSLGINVTRLRMEVFFCCALATSLLVALTGVIGFIGLMVPHMCRYFSGVKHLLLLPLCGMWGAVLLCGGDIVSRTLLAPQELPIGIITAGIGGLFIIILLARNRS
ncbi:iron ABC transporter permease [Klebsiella michiganensis]|uniref:FecCD family ABC transporter permease n=1 Tax=Klebsiella michiganensis TaxID=1134687 RepID=UPI0016505799|nr:iron ABC transporter permease [Klebsiella michiganensis]ELT9748736.1 iron ABC transporter permease [Klebsiella michiganensis]MBF8471335.1 iron ABC transporter permease [Klebsiella michiganensis]MBZ6601498.1 iron ABC transporter permease [Klebsiella michiganensis]MCJ5867743.1 iron ABC transporter permease [Klebsiella michiganensis]GKQ21025.1 ABC transporter permease [Klebsiella michiganensis]